MAYSSQIDNFSFLRLYGGLLHTVSFVILHLSWALMFIKKINHFSLPF